MCIRGIAVLLLTLAGLGGPLVGQGFRALDAGSAAAARQQARSANQARLQAELAAGEEAARRRAAHFTRVDDVESFFRAVDTCRRAEIRALYQARESLRTERALSPRLRRERIDAYNRQILDLSRPGKAYVPELSLGRVRTLGSVRIVQVVDGGQAIVNLGGVDELGLRSPAADVWLARVDTSGWTDDRHQKLDAVYIQRGTEQFDTLAGPRTITRLEPLGVSLGDERFGGGGERRWWTIDDGQPVEATLLLYEQGRVRIRAADGEERLIRAQRLSPLDRTYLDALVRRPKSRQ